MELSNYFYFAVLSTLCIFSCGKEEIEIEATTVGIKKESVILNTDISQEDLAFRSAICINGGEVLTVAKRGNPDMNFFNNENYRVIWTANEHQIVANGTQTDCLCGTMVHVTVTDLINESSATISYPLMNCIDDDNL